MDLALGMVYYFEKLTIMTGYFRHAWHLWICHGSCAAKSTVRYVLLFNLESMFFDVDLWCLSLIVSFSCGICNNMCIYPLFYVFSSRSSGMTSCLTCCSFLCQFVLGFCDITRDPAQLERQRQVLCGLDPAAEAAPS